MLGQATTTLDKMAPRLGAPTWPKFQQAFVEAADVVVAVALKKVQYQKFHCQYIYIHIFCCFFVKLTWSSLIESWRIYLITLRKKSCIKQYNIFEQLWSLKIFFIKYKNIKKSFHVAISRNF